MRLERAACASGLGGGREGLAVLNEARALGDAVVEHHRLGVALMSVPVDARAPLSRSHLVHMLDERAADARAADLTIDEQVLQVAIILDRPAAPVADVMHEPDLAPLAKRERAIHRLLGIEQ